MPGVGIERLPAGLRATVAEAVRRIVEGYGPVEKILLFGSAARGEQDEASDLDLIVIKRTTERFLRRLVSVPDLGTPADVFVYTPEEFAEMQAEENPFVLTALRDAVVLYEAGGDG
ncbi:MAG: nucleotidyltransferase domain-containing protein [Bryobacterales bacterium]|nr:nucleotidyltransferase domain-containing protein [Bryobacteraceae bacterium]MDW8354087.1 nucleotidyltransferase domain-containing protein [Bryobacterales bacterium]